MGFHVRSPTLPLSHPQPLDNLGVKYASLQTKNLAALQRIETMASSSYVPPHVCRMRYFVQACYFAGSSDRVSDSSSASSNIDSFVTKFAVLLYRR